MKSLPREINLQRAFDTLNHSEEDGRGENQDGHPEGVPLDRVPAIIPPLPQPARAGLVEGLLQDDQSVVPEGKLLEPPVLSSQASSLGDALVQAVFGNLLQDPASRFFVVLREQERQSLESLTDEAIREYLFGQTAECQRAAAVLCT